jgi:hypothetical protein
MRGKLNCSGGWSFDIHPVIAQNAWIGEPTIRERPFAAAPHFG